MLKRKPWQTALHTPTNWERDNVEDMTPMRQALHLWAPHRVIIRVLGNLQERWHYRNINSPF